MDDLFQNHGFRANGPLGEGGEKMTDRMHKRKKGSAVRPMPLFRNHGGPGSGNFGHEGRPGEKGGSGGGGGSSSSYQGSKGHFEVRPLKNDPVGFTHEVFSHTSGHSISKWHGKDETAAHEQAKRLAGDQKESKNETPRHEELEKKLNLSPSNAKKYANYEKMHGTQKMLDAVKKQIKGKNK